MRRGRGSWRRYANSVATVELSIAAFAPPLRIDKMQRRRNRRRNPASALHGNSPVKERVGEAMDRDRLQSLLRWTMAAFYSVAGILHLWAPSAFLPIVPGWVPLPREIVLLTGVCEIAGAAALLTRRFRWWAGVMLALYAVCVFPANVKHALDSVQAPGLPTSWWYHGPRLALQPVIVWWALFCGRVIDWPFKSTTRRDSA